MRVVARGLVLVGLMAVAGFAFASDEVSQSSPYLIADSRVSPEYPPAAQAARWEGTVILAAQVLTDGTVGEIEIVESTHPRLGFEQSATAAMRQWRFEPAQYDGQAVEAVSMFRLAFKIPGTRSRNFPYVAGQQMVSKLAQPGLSASVSASVSAFGAEGNNRTTSTAARDRIMKMGRPPVMAEGAMYDRPGHISGAINVPVPSLVDDAGRFRGLDELDALFESDRDTRTITYCGGGIAAAADAFVMTRLGFTDVAVYDASLDEWAADPDNPMDVVLDFDESVD